jgi:ribosomal protein S6--L-glutamate ligase
VRRGMEAAQQRGIQVDRMEVGDIQFVADGRGVLRSPDCQDIVSHYDALIVRSFMPFVSESISIARLFQDAGKVVVDQNLTEEGYAMSKMHDYLLLARAGIAVPQTYQCFDPIEAERRACALGFPCILKGIYGSEGRTVFKADNLREFRRILWRRKLGNLMVQEFLPAEYDFRVITVGYQALPLIVRRKPQAGEFRTNFEFNEEVVPLATVDHNDLKALAESAARTLRREFSGVDIRYRGPTPLVLEANRRPGFKAFEEATGCDVAGALIDYVLSRCRTASTRV